MQIHRVFPDSDIHEEMTDPEPCLGLGDASIATLDMHMQALWVFIAVSIVVGLNGVLSWI